MTIYERGLEVLKSQGFNAELKDGILVVYSNEEGSSAFVKVANVAAIASEYRPTSEEAIELAANHLRDARQTLEVIEATKLTFPNGKLLSILKEAGDCLSELSLHWGKGLFFSNQYRMKMHAVFALRREGFIADSVNVEELNCAVVRVYARQSGLPPITLTEKDCELWANTYEFDLKRVVDFAQSKLMTASDQLSVFKTLRLPDEQHNQIVAILDKLLYARQALHSIVENEQEAAQYDEQSVECKATDSIETAVSENDDSANTEKTDEK